MRWRAFQALLGSALLLCAGNLQAEQAGVPTIGILSSRSPAESAALIAVLRQGLASGGFSEGQNVAIEFRWAEGQYDRLPRMAADLVSRQVAVIIAVGNDPSALAAKAATKTIPIVFAAATDPVRLGLVDSLSRPNGNLTGVSCSDLLPKRLELLHELVPSAKVLAFLVNPNSPRAEYEIGEARSAADKLGVRLQVLTASDAQQLEEAFASAKREAGGIGVQGDPLLGTLRDRTIRLAANYGIPVMYLYSYNATAGGLMSYGPNLSDCYRQVGVYASRILKREKPGDLPVQLPTKFEFVINLRTAKALGIEIPPSLLDRADEVIE